MSQTRGSSISASSPSSRRRRPATTVQPVVVPAELRVTLPELTDFFTCAWQVATMVLPLAATDDPIAATPAGAPRIELYIQSERPITQPARERSERST